MRKFTKLMLLAALLFVPWATNAQDCTQTVTQSQPYVQDFDSVTGTTYSTAGQLPDCWLSFTNGTTAGYKPHVVGSGTYWYTHSGSKALGMTSGSSSYGSTKYVLMPPVSAPLSQLELTFWMCTESSSSGTLYVGYVTSDDTSTFTPIQTYPASSATVHSGSGLQATAGATYTLSLANVPANATRIAFKWFYASSYYSCFIDDVVLGYAPTCPRVDNISVIPGPDNALVRWTETGDAAEWEVVLSDTNGTVASQIVYEDSAEFNNLTPQTDYTVSIRAICDVDDTSAVRSFDFTTACAAIAATQLPWSYNFDDGTTGTTGNFGNTCLGRYRQGTTTAYPYPSSTYHLSGTASAYFYGTAAITSWLTLPLFETPLNGLYLTFYALKTSANYGHITVGVMSNPSDPTTFTAIENVQVQAISTSSNQQWERFDIDLSSYEGNGQYITFMCSPTAACYTYIDSVTVGLPPTCYISTDLAVDSAGINAVRLTWSNNSPSVNSYRVYYSTTPNFNIDTCLTYVTVTDTIAEISNLPSNTDFYWTVVADCGGGDISDVPAQQTFHTLRDCGDDLLNVIGTIGQGTSTSTNYFAYPSTSYPIGYTASIFTAEELLDLGLQTGAYINNISVNTGATGGTINNLTIYLAETNLEEFSGVSDTAMLNSLTPYWSGDFTCTSGEWNTITLDSAFYYSGTGNLIVYAFRDTVSSAAVSSYYGSTSPSYRSIYGYKTATASATARPSATRSTSRVNMRFDMCAEQPSCLRPTTANVTADDQSITLTWNGCDNATSYLVEYSVPNSNVVNVEEVTVPTVTISDLPMGTTYNISIRTVCGSDTTFAYYTTATTQCHLLTTADLPLTEDFEAYGSGSTETISPCWAKGTTNSTAYPYPSNTSTAAIAGDRGLYFFSSTSYYSWVCLPAVDLDEMQMSDLELTFQLKRYSSTSSTYRSEIILGVMSTPGNFNTFDTLQVYDLSSLPASEVMSYNVSLADYQGTGNRIAFLAPVTSSGTNYIGLDNVMLSEALDCPTPSNLTLVSATADSVYVAWDASDYPDSWYVYIGTPGFSIDTVYPETAYDTIIGIGGLNDNTEYEVIVISSCSGQLSNATMPFSVRTACTALTSDDLPYSEDFESYATGSSADIDPCWTKGTNGSTAYPYPDNAAAYLISGGKSLHMYGYLPSSATTTQVYSYAALPEYDGDLADLRLRFKSKRYNSTANYYTSLVVVGVMTDPTNISTFDTVAIFDMKDEESGAIWDNEVFFDSYTGTGHNVAFLAPIPPLYGSTYTYNYVGIDDIILDEAPSCRRSSDLAVDSLSHNAALVSWTNASQSTTGYTVYYSTQSNFNIDTCQTYVTSTTTSALITGLDNWTTYYWTVIADCGSENSEMPARQSFRTLLDCGTGYVNILDTIGEGTNSGYTYFAYNYNSYPYGYTANIFSAAELAQMGLIASANINSISVQAGATACTIPSLKVYMAETSLDGFTGASDTNLLNTLNLVQVYDSTLTTSANEWAEMQLSTPFNYSGNNNLLIIFERTSAPTASGTFYYGSTSPNYYTLYGYRSSTSNNRTATRGSNRVNLAFNLCAEMPACPRPTDVAITSLGDTFATINWVSNATSFEYVIGTSGVDPNSASVTPITTTTNYVALNNLTPNTGYDFFVRSICGNEVSDWSIMASFTTACSPMPLPYTEDFNSYGTGTTASINGCWVKGTNNTTQYPYPNNAASYQIDGNYLYFYAYHPSSASTTPIYSYAALPMMDADIDTLSVSFSMRRYGTTTDSYTSRIVVGVMTDPNDINTFAPVDTIDMRNEEAYAQVNYEVKLDSYTGNGKFIAFYDEVPPLYGTATASYSYVILDNIIVDYIPLCPRIFDITVDTATENTANIHWFNPNGNNGFGYTVEYGPEGFALGSGTQLTTIDTFITITGLSASTGYDFYVRPACSATEDGPWSFATPFRTVCGIYTVPYYEDFESYSAGTAATIDPCWTKGTNNTSTAYPYPNNATSYLIGGQRYLYFYGYQPSTASSTPYYSYIALPEFNVGLDSLAVSFKMRRYSTTSNYYTSRLLVGVMTDPADISTFVGIDTIDLKDSAASALVDIEVNLNSYTGTGKHIALYDAVPPLYGTGTYSYSYVYVDDLRVDLASPCGRPHNLQTVSTTDNSITIDWADTVGATQWMVEYGPAGFERGTGTQVLATMKPFTITGLTASTLYDIYVRSYCNTATLSGYNANTFSASTSQMPAALPYTYDFENAAEWQNWQTISNNQVNWYRGTAEAAQGNYGLYVSTDSGATCNSLHSTITNAAAYRDIDFGTTESSFEVTFLAKSAGVNDGNYEGINVMLVDPSIPVTAAASTSLTSPWGTFNTVHVVRDTNWNSYTVLFDNISGVKRLVFNWYTSTSTTHPVWDGAGAIDSIAVTEQSCIRPNNTTVTNIGDSFVSLSWDGDPADSYLVRLREVGTTTNIDNTTTTNSITVSNLQPQTDYYVWVYHVCGQDDISYSAPRIQISTTCAPIVAFDTLFEDFDSYTPVAYNATGGVLPDCWEGYSNGSNAAYMPHITDGGSYSYSITGNPITMTSGGSTYGDTKIVRLPKFAEPVNTLTMSYWYCTENSTSGTLYVGYMTGLNYETDFVPIATRPASSASVHSNNGPQTGHGVFDTIHFDTVPSNALFIAFKWVYNSSFYSVCIDNVEVTSSGLYCATPTVSAGTPEYDNASIYWSGTATNYEVGIKLATDAAFNDADNIAVTGNSYNFSGLTPNTTYQARVRALCDSVLISEWAVVTFTTAELPCFVPTDLQADPNYTDATFNWNADASQTTWTLHIWNSAFDQEYDVTANPYTATGLTQNTTYNAAIKAVCGGGAAESEYGDTISFTTSTCAVVTGVVANATSAHTATVTWNATEATSYEVNYGPRGFQTGDGEFVTVTTASANLTGLNPQSNYDVYVRALCGTGVQSNWSEAAQFSTPAGDGISTAEGTSLSIYPNPTTSATTIALSGVNGEVTITIVDMNGRVVMSDSMSCEGDCTKTMEVSGLAQGAYFVRISGESTNMVKKLVVK